jgi:hypothetical protein
MSGKGNVLMKGLRIKRTGKLCHGSRKWRYWEKLGRGTSTAVVRYQYSVNELRIHFIKKNEDKMMGNITTSSQSRAEFSCYVTVTSSSKICGWKKRDRNYC